MLEMKKAFLTLYSYTKIDDWLPYKRWKSEDSEKENFQRRIFLTRMKRTFKIKMLSDKQKLRYLIKEVCTKGILMRKKKCSKR